jgi:UDP-N-acetylglucosamine enolpyruvyl transferase
VVHLHRGYERLVDALQGLGADIDQATLPTSSPLPA